VRTSRHVHSREPRPSDETKRAATSSASNVLVPHRLAGPDSLLLSRAAKPTDARSGANSHSSDFNCCQAETLWPNTVSYRRHTCTTTRRMRNLSPLSKGWHHCCVRLCTTMSWNAAHNLPLASPTSRSASPDACRESGAAAFQASDPKNERLCWCWSASTPLRPSTTRCGRWSPSSIFRTPSRNPCLWQNGRPLRPARLPTRSARADPALTATARRFFPPPLQMPVGN
jgi:hypothetical protein